MGTLFSVIVLEFIMTHYKTLGIAPNASQKEIKQAYYTLSRKWHPDKNKSPEASSMFCKIGAAYEVLSDSTSRATYDRELNSQHNNLSSYASSTYEDLFARVSEKNLNELLKKTSTPNDQQYYVNLFSKFNDIDLNQVMSLIEEKNIKPYMNPFFSQNISKETKEKLLNSFTKDALTDLKIMPNTTPR